MYLLSRLFIFVHFLSLSISAQIGVIWTESIAVAAPEYGYTGPKIELLADGSPLVIWGKSATHEIFQTRWNGAGFNIPSAVHTGDLHPMIHSVEGPSLATAGDTVFISMETMSNPAYGMFTIRSLDGGQNFDEPVRIYEDPERRTILPVVNTGPGGQPFVNYISSNNSFTDARYEIVRSTDGGLTYAPPVSANSQEGGGIVCECCKAGTVISADSVFLLYRNNFSNLRDMWLSLSTDGAENFEYGLDIDNTDWIINSCPTSGPDGVVFDGHLWVAMMSGASMLNKVYLSRIDPVTLELEGQILLAGENSGSFQNHPRIATNRHIGAVVWQDQYSTDVDVWVTILDEELLQNATLTYPITNESGSQDNPDIAINADKIFVVYEDASTQQIMCKIGFISNYNTSIYEHLFQVKSPIIYDHKLYLDDPSLPDEITIYDNQGKIMHKGARVGGEAISVAGWPAGLYILWGQKSGRWVSAKIYRP